MLHLLLLLFKRPQRIPDLLQGLFFVIAAGSLRLLAAPRRVSGRRLAAAAGNGGRCGGLHRRQSRGHAAAQIRVVSSHFESYHVFAVAECFSPPQSLRKICNGIRNRELSDGFREKSQSGIEFARIVIDT